MNIRIKDICRFGKKSDIKAGEGNTKGKYMFFTSSIDKDKRIDKFDYDEEGIIMGTGGNATLHYYSGKFAVSTDCLVLLPNSSYKCKYLYYFFLHNMRVLEGGFRGAGLKHTSKSYIENIELTKTHSLLEQDKIISVLSNIDNTIVLQNKRLKLLNELTRSLFIEMFGDPIKNEKDWRINKFRDICTVRQGLQIPISKRLLYKEDNCYEYITVAYLHGSKEREYIKNPKETVICNKEDILMTRTGNTGMVITGVHGVFHNNFFLIDFDRYKFDKCFLVEYLNLELIQLDIMRRAGSSTIPDLNHDEFYKINVYVPPLDLQKRFAEYVSSIDKSKFASFLHLSA